MIRMSRMRNGWGGDEGGGILTPSPPGRGAGVRESLLLRYGAVSRRIPTAGGARQRVTFLVRPRKITKRRPPRFRRNPGAADAMQAAKELASLRQLSPAFGYPA